MKVSYLSSKSMFSNFTFSLFVFSLLISQLKRAILCLLLSEMDGQIMLSILMAKVHQYIDVLSTLPDNKNGSWSSLKDADENTLQLLSFTNAQIINYFVVRTAVDGTPASDMKAINSSALNLFKCGHVQNIQICIVEYLYVTSN